MGKPITLSKSVYRDLDILKADCESKMPGKIYSYNEVIWGLIEFYKIIVNKPVLEAEKKITPGERGRVMREEEARLNPMIKGGMTGAQKKMRNLPP